MSIRNRSSRRRSSRDDVVKAKPGSNGKVITGKARSTFMKILKLEDDGKGNRVCTTGVLIPKKDKKTVGKIRATIIDVARKKFGEDVNIFKSKRLRNPLHDADELIEDPESSVGKESAGCFIINTKSYKIPQVVNKHNERITDFEELEEICVSGYYFYFSITFKAFDIETDQGRAKGVRCLLNNIMYIGEGERLDGGKSAEEDFEDYAIDDDDDDEWEDD